MVVGRLFGSIVWRIVVVVAVVIRRTRSRRRRRRGRQVDGMVCGFYRGSGPLGSTSIRIVKRIPMRRWVGHGQQTTITVQPLKLFFLKR